MKNILFTRIQSTCICFTLIVLGNWGFNLLCANETSFFCLIVFVWLIVCQFIDFLISKIEFRKWSHYCIAESAVFYLLSLLFFRLFVWDGMDASIWITFTVIFLVTDGFIFWYFRKRQEIQAQEINELIRAREENHYARKRGKEFDV